jgi:peptidoglycan/LPS O-acetylase OafA/YrhL
MLYNKVMHKDNNFGFLRLLFAYLVIVAHASVLPSANSTYQHIYPIIYPLANGSLPVEGFFLISGYLIYKSYTQSSSAISYFSKRILRIYPGFIAASLFCLLIVAPISGGVEVLKALSLTDWLQHVLKMLALLQVSITGSFPNNHLPLNSPMWTIKFEFICYLLVPLFVIFLKKKSQLFVLFVCVASLHVLSIHLDWHKTIPFIYKFSKLLSAFLVGSLFYVYREHIVWRKTYSLIAVLILIPILYLPYLADIGLMLCGGYLLFNFAFHYPNKVLANVGKNTDISYGVYLYAWPINGMLVQFIPGGAWLHLGLTIILASVFGYLSWRLIEKPFMQMKHRLQVAR